MILKNYHTHTPRCHHAVGSERMYIEAAIAKGFQTLGFSDHVPWPFKDGFVSKIRMGMEDLDDYFDTLLRLREEYKDRIEIPIGFEAEYFPSMFEELMGVLRNYPLDYLILGQHNVRDEAEGFYAGAPTEDPQRLIDYVDVTIEGIRTGVFSYVAHPDLIRFDYRGREELYRQEMGRLCVAAKECGIPLEVNFYGYTTKRNYPCGEFFRLASSLGSSFILGCDAHQPWLLAQPEEVSGLEEFLKRNQISYSQELELRKPV